MLTAFLVLAAFVGGWMAANYATPRIARWLDEAHSGRDDEIDSEVARRRIAEIEKSPRLVVEGEALRERLARIEG